MHFNEREYDRMNALSLLALGGMGLSIVYMVFMGIAVFAFTDVSEESSTKTAHLWISVSLVVIFVVIAVMTAPRYERQHEAKELINEYMRVLKDEDVEGITMLTPEQSDIVVSASRSGTSYVIFIESVAGLHSLVVMPTYLGFAASNRSASYDTEKYARALLAFLNGDQFALRGLLREMGTSINAS